jgi:carboxylesterase type B
MSSPCLLIVVVGVWDASDFRESCLQGPFSPPITNTSESCLYLNVYAPLPPADPSVRFPVMVWVHGGSYS